MLAAILVGAEHSSYADQFIVGVGTHIFGQDKGQNIRALQELGVNGVRDEFLWDRVETQKGNPSIPKPIREYLAALDTNKVSALFILGYGNKFYDGGKKPTSVAGVAAYVNYAKFATVKLGGKVKYFEVWNEWDNSGDPTSPEEYMRLLKAVAPAIKSIDPNVKVLAGAATLSGVKKGWVEKIISLGALRYADGVSLHPYVHCEKDPSPEAWIDLIARYERKFVSANNNREVPLYLSEMGWPTHLGACGSSPETAGQDLSRALLLVRTVPAVKGFWWYDLKNDGRDPANREHNFGLMLHEYQPKPAYYAFKDVVPFVLHARQSRVVPSPEGTVLVEMVENDGRKVYGVWAKSAKVRNVEISYQTAERPSFLHVGGAEPGVFSPEPRRSSVLTLDGSPVLISGLTNITSIRVAEGERPFRAPNGGRSREDDRRRMRAEEWRPF